MKKRITDIRRAREHFRKVFSIPVVLGFRPSTYSETTEFVRTAGPPDERGVKTTIRTKVVRGHCRGTMTDFELLVCWNHLSDEEVLAIVRNRGEKVPRSEYRPMVGVAEQVARLRGLL